LKNVRSIHLQDHRLKTLPALPDFRKRSSSFHSPPFRTFSPDLRTTPRWPTAANVN
jgi:hypothetical protein